MLKKRESPEVQQRVPYIIMKEVIAMIDLSKYGITGVTEIVHNPSYEALFEAEMDPTLEGYEKGQLTELGAVNVMSVVMQPYGMFAITAIPSVTKTLTCG